jgi:hypothetical protein
MNADIERLNLESSDKEKQLEEGIALNEKLIAENQKLIEENERLKEE